MSTQETNKQTTILNSNTPFHWCQKGMNALNGIHMHGTKNSKIYWANVNLYNFNLILAFGVIQSSFNIRYKPSEKLSNTLPKLLDTLHIRLKTFHFVPVSVSTIAYAKKGISRKTTKIRPHAPSQKRFLASAEEIFRKGGQPEPFLGRVSTLSFRSLTVFIPKIQGSRS